MTLLYQIGKQRIGNEKRDLAGNDRESLFDLAYGHGRNCGRQQTEDQP